MTEIQREQIKDLRLQGYGYKRIATALSLSVNTVKSYCRTHDLTGVMAEQPKPGPMDATYCKHCGKELAQKPSQKTLLFCSNDCRQAWWNAHPEQVKRKAIYTYRCPRCGEAFTAYGNAYRTYCSHPCYITHRFGGQRHD